MSSADTPVTESEFADAFDEVGARLRSSWAEPVLLSSANAQTVWSTRFAPGAHCYFVLPDDCWACTAEWRSLGEWQPDYAGGDTERVGRSLRTSLPWTDSTAVLFCGRTSSTIRTTWRTFLQGWDAFLSAEDDAPIVIPEDPTIDGAVLFTNFDVRVAVSRGE